MATMRQVSIKGDKGPAENLFIEQVPRPVPQGSQVLVKIMYFGLNRMDISQREGRYPMPPHAPKVLGVEFSGVVEESANGFTKGEEVFGLAYGGAYAEYIASHAETLIRKPKELKFEDAAGIPEVWFTATQALFIEHSFKSGESALFHAGASGVGQALIHLAKDHGASAIYATAGSDSKCRLIEKVGATRGINYNSEDFAKVVNEETGGKGVDMIVDFVIGNGYLEKELEIIARDGTIILLGAMGGPVTQAPLKAANILVKRATVRGSTLRSRTLEYQSRIKDKFVKESLPKIISGEYAANVETVMDWKDIIQAHKLMESNTPTGRIIMKVA